MFQDHLLYFPTSAPLAEVVAEARRGGLEPWPDANDFRGLLREPRAAARGTLVFFHGNAGHAGHRGWVAEALANAGLRVILAEYPGYGPRPGQPGEAALVRDAAETLARVREQFPGPLLVGGESLGAGVAAAVAANSPGEISGLLLITPWDSL
ncbi:MAG: alpha/beta fold hydrolase, partial [Candidatus Dechloromonas phosphoritropha]